jgi:hypothetical protein
MSSRSAIFPIISRVDELAKAIEKFQYHPIYPFLPEFLN